VSQVIGQHITDATRQEIAREINKLEPHAFIDVRYIGIQENKYIVAIQVNAGNHPSFKEK
jgi:ATP-dependent DNA helicase RecG